MPCKSLLHVARRSCRSIGLDWSDVMLAAGRAPQPACGCGRRSRLVRGDFARLPFIDDIADAILAVNVVYFMANSAALGEARRVLRPGGRMVLYATDGSSHASLAFCRTPTRIGCSIVRGLTPCSIDAGFASDRIRIEDSQCRFWQFLAFWRWRRKQRDRSLGVIFLGPKTMRSALTADRRAAHSREARATQTTPCISCLNLPSRQSTACSARLCRLRNSDRD